MFLLLSHLHYVICKTFIDLVKIQQNRVKLKISLSSLFRREDKDRLRWFVQRGDVGRESEEVGEGRHHSGRLSGLLGLYHVGRNGPHRATEQRRIAKVIYSFFYEKMFRQFCIRVLFLMYQQICCFFNQSNCFSFLFLLVVLKL